MKDLFSLLNDDIRIQELNDPLFSEKKIKVSVLRLDEIDPVISGNKLFKLEEFLGEALLAPSKSVLTFGGAWSNHLAATAAASKSLGLSSIGIVRGERPASPSQTLIQCEEAGMELRFIERKEYEVMKQGFKGDQFTIIPEGGYSVKGVKGASGIVKHLKKENYSHAICTVGTATTIAGLDSLRQKKTKLIGIPVLKGMSDLHKRLKELLGHDEGYDFIHDYHFGGYAKSNPSLIEFMNLFYERHKIPTDFVYTAKMFFGVYDLAAKNYFPFNSKIACLHTGGLQGNLSLPAGSLAF